MPRMLTSPKPLVSETTPGVDRAKADQRRLLIGIFCRAAVLSVSVKSGDSRFMTGACSVTTTSVEDEATARRGSRVVTWPTTTTTFSARYLAKLGEVMVTVYLPGSRRGALK